jgi:hypothetical protein
MNESLTLLLTTLISNGICEKLKRLIIIFFCEVLGLQYLFFIESKFQQIKILLVILSGVSYFE